MLQFYKIHTLTPCVFLKNNRQVKLKYRKGNVSCQDGQEKTMKMKIQILVWLSQWRAWILKWLNGWDCVWGDIEDRKGQLGEECIVAGLSKTSEEENTEINQQNGQVLEGEAKLTAEWLTVLRDGWNWKMRTKASVTAPQWGKFMWGDKATLHTRSVSSSFHWFLFLLLFHKDLRLGHP